MWGSSEEPPGTMEAGPPESVANLKETYEQNKNQLESVKDIMLRNKESIKKKEEELEEYTKKLSKFKTRAKRSRSKKDDRTSSSESTPKTKSDISISQQSSDVLDDVSQAKTPKAKSSLLQKKLAEDRKIFERRSKELTESKRAVEEKVEALRQQLDEKYVAPSSVINPAVISQITHSTLESGQVQEKDNKITELNNKIYELESVIIDLQENLKEKDSVIDSKTKAVTLMSADLSKKGKTTLDTLEDTKDEMRSMQENFILVETSLRSKNENLLKQLEEKTSQISVLEENIESLNTKIEVQKQAETVSADFSRSTMDTLVDTKDAMKSMQENFILIETSLKEKNEYLLKQLEEREIKLAEAEARILNLESGIGIEKKPDLENLIYKVEKLEKMNHDLQDEKYEFQKSIAELQDKIISNSSSIDNNLIAEKDNRIAELENLIEELKKSNQSLEEEHKLELNKQISALNERNDQMSQKMMDYEKQVQDLENERIRLTTLLNENDNSKEDERVQQLTKELDELNKSMIKLKAQHKNKLKNMQKQLENFKKISDTNAELVKLGNQVTLLEEEKGNLQLSLVDFDELKALAGDWQKRISDLEGKVSAQVNEIQAHIQSIAILENQKLDLMQELHAVKQEVSSLEAENAESENLRVTAEMKVVDLEEELESLHKQRTEVATESERSEYERQIENLTQENERLSQKISKFEELKSSSEVGSTESFVKTGSNVDSTESFEALAADNDKSDLLKKIDFLTKENGILSEKLSRFEEKGSSDSGSAESFERIPEQGESTSRLENLSRENYELVIKLTKLEEKLATESTDNRIQLLNEENERLISEIAHLQERLAHMEEESRLKRSLDLSEEIVLQTEAHSTVIPDDQRSNINADELMIKIESLTAQNEELNTSLKELQHNKQELDLEKQAIEQEKQKIEQDKKELDQIKQDLERKKQESKQEKQELLVEPVETDVSVQESHEVEEVTVTLDNVNLQTISQQLEEIDNKSSNTNIETIASLESEIERCNILIKEQNNFIDEMKMKLADKEEELEHKSIQIAKENEVTESDMRSLRRELEENASVISEWMLKCSEMENKMAILEQDKQRIEEGLQVLQNEKEYLIGQSEQKESVVISLREELESTIRGFEEKLREQSKILSSEEQLVDEFKKTIKEKEIEIQEKSDQLLNDTIKINELQDELKIFDIREQQRDATITSLTEEIKVLTSNITVIEEDLFSARHQIVVLEEKLKNTKSTEEYYQISQQFSEKEVLVEELEVKLAQKTTESNSLKSQVESLAADNERIRLHLEDEERKIAELLEANESQEEALKNSERAKAEVENRLMDLQITYDENLRHHKNISSELQDAYKMLEQLKFKHTEDTDMLNRRLMDVIEELQSKTHQLTNLQSEFEEFKIIASMSVSPEVKANLEAQIAELEQKVSDAEEKTKAQLDKMKKYAAVAKKKAIQVEELETKLHDLEEQLSFEKNEKETKSHELAESISDAQEKDNRITDLEEDLKRLQLEKVEALQNVATIEAELNEAKEKLTVINKELLSLSNAKDDARELGVRMHVMETEYVEQLAQINSLKAENGFLLSKQTQINERLENVEKESEERRAQLEKLEKEREIAETEKSEKSQETCGQCVTRVQALEAKLQERDAEIENLDNELHNSIGNLVQMQENLRLSTIPAPAQDTLLQDAYHELTIQYNTLTTANEDMKARYESVLRDNEELRGRLDSLQELNITLQHRTYELEEDLTRARESITSLEILSSNYDKHIKTLEKDKLELEHIREKDMATGSRERDEREISGDGWDFEDKSEIIDALNQNLEQVPVNETMERQKREAPNEELSLPLFDGSVFSTPRAEFVKVEQDQEISKLRDEVAVLNKQLEDERDTAQHVQTRLYSELEEAKGILESVTQELNALKENRQELETIIASKNIEMKALNIDASSTNDALVSVRTEFEQLTNSLKEKDALIESIENEKSNYFIQLQELSLEKQNIQVAIKELFSNLSIVDDVLSNVEKIEKLKIKISDVLQELKDLKLENQKILSNKEVLKNEAAQEFSEEFTRLQGQLYTIAQERDQLIEELKALRNIQQQEQLVETVTTAPLKVNDPTSVSMWEDDEDPWGFNDKVSSQVVDEPYVNIPVIPSNEIQLKLRVDELEQQLQELTEQNTKLVEDGKLAQVKTIKYVKKLKEYKIQFDNLQRELKSQKSIGGFGDLDSTIENELKAQIENLEKTLINLKEENKKVVMEKDSLIKRIDVLTAATERFTEAKEKQDTEMHIWQKRYRDLEIKLQQLDFGPETSEASSSTPQETVENPKYQEELKELKDNVEALAAENEELQQLLDQNRINRQASIEETLNQVQDLQSKNADLITNNEMLKLDYENLKTQYEQCLIDVNNQAQEKEKAVSELNEWLFEVLQENSVVKNRILELEGNLESLNKSRASYDSLTELVSLHKQEVSDLTAQLQRYEAEKIQFEETKQISIQQLTDELTEKQIHLDQLKNLIQTKDDELNRQSSEIEELRSLSKSIEEFKLSIEHYQNEVQKKDDEIQALRESLHSRQSSLAEYEQQLTSQQSQFEQLTTEMQHCTSEVKSQQQLTEKLAEMERHNTELQLFISEKDSSLVRSNEEIQKLEQELHSKQLELEDIKSKLEALVQERSTVNIQKVFDTTQEATKFADDNIPVFTFGNDENDKQLNILKAELKAKNEEIEHLRYTVDDSSTTHMIQDLQDNVNLLYNEKSDLESELIARNQEIGALKSQILELQAQQGQPVKRSLEEQDELLKLQNELHIRDQQMSDLQFVIAEKESQLRAAQERSNFDSQQQDLIEKLKTELYEKQQELEGLKFTVSELQSEVATLRGLERLAAEDRAIIQRLTSEKEEVRIRAEEDVQQLLREKEREIDHLKQQLPTENQALMQTLNLKEHDIEKLNLQVEELVLERERLFEQSIEQSRRMETELSERDRRLAELSITKDTESHNLRMQLGEKTVRLEELIALSEEEEKQLADMRKLLEVKEQQINGLTQQLEEKAKEYEIMQHALRQHIKKTEQLTESQHQQVLDSSDASDEVSTSNKLDLALNMLHHRDVRCEELTHELMQLLEERDTLQLRLSNAIAINEELRKLSSVSSSHKKDSLMVQGEDEPHIEDPSSSKSEGPVEIAKEAINLPISEDKKALALKLSQLRDVDQARDLRLRDDREMRHMEQMSLLMHGDMLSSLPPEAAARLVNANYTLSRDVQSQSSVLMNWLWGKSTPKVVHM